ncbi:hypothetical protein H5P28_08495 [Ruficoccus amylovorans]|uniref:LPXTG cell wall anchor domain-containing protein n=1 Tax=Ruficoccus amylovorans TaxID=1804625 RepID=A0A842HDL1_9BACT|nr:hypothetical protein [Ruficoccus amylovorans]MBC2594299.1 hypothetical protein [Ruficoccus amylovorans]
MKSKICALFSMSLMLTATLSAASTEAAGGSSVQNFGGIFLMVGGFAVLVFVAVTLCRRCRRRSKLTGLSHLF